MLGGGAGHILDLIARNKANQALRKQKSRFRKDFFKFDHGIPTRNRSKIFQDKKPTNYRKEEIKKEALADKIKEKTN